jgi:Ni,Fe-hydrogenase I large subunit
MEKNEIIKRGADLRVLEFLKDLQNNIYDSNIIYLDQMARKHKIGTCYGKSLVDLKIIKRLGNKNYLWLGNNPSLIMARKILKYYREHKYKNAIENKQIEIKFKEPVKNKFEINLEKRYNNYLNELYKIFENNKYVDLYSITSKYKNGNQFSAILQVLKIIKKIEQKKFIWVGRKPSKQMVVKLIQEIKLYNSVAKNKDLEIKKTDTNFKKSNQTPNKNIIKPLIKTRELNKNFSLSILWGLIKINK